MAYSPRGGISSLQNLVYRGPWKTIFISPTSNADTFPEKVRADLLRGAYLLCFHGFNSPSNEPEWVQWVHDAPDLKDCQLAMNSEFGERLRLERERLGLSQGEFASKAGVHRNTQVRYETGKREADSGYLSRIQELGVDYGFLLFGQRTTATNVFRLAATRLLPGIMARANLSGRALIDILDIASMDEAAIWGPGEFQKLPSEFSSLLNAFFEDGELLADIFEEVRRASFSNGLEVSHPKLVRLVAMLYRSFKAGGKVDPAMIEEAIKLAAG